MRAARARADGSNHRSPTSWSRACRSATSPSSPARAPPRTRAT
jgi:hypothetical protein